MVDQMTGTAGQTYRLGRLITSTMASYRHSYPRPLIDEATGKIVAIVSSNAGPATVGSMSIQEVRERFGIDPAASGFDT